jgi:hypothetical protein
VIGNGQSLSTGTNQAPISLTQFRNNGKLSDSLGTTSGYVLASPTAPTLSRVPLVAPQKPIPGGLNSYPKNTTGESIEISLANQLTALALADGYRDWDMSASCTGMASQPMANIQKGGNSHAYEAGIYEALALQNLATLAGRSFSVFAVSLKHGETDAENAQGTHTTSPAAYLAQLVALQANYQVDVPANGMRISHPSGVLPMVMSQQNAAPGALGGHNITADAMLQAARLYPALFILTGPTYPYPNDGIYHPNEYRPLGEKASQFLYKWWKGLDYAPLWPTSIVRSGTNVTVNLHVPVGPLVWDTTTIPAPHQTGIWSMWANAMGFEAWDNPLVVASATNASPSVVGFTTTHNLTTGATYALEGICDSTATAGNNAVNGVWTVTVVDPTHVSLNGSTGNGTYVSGGVGFAPIAFASAPTISGNSVNLVLSRAPTTGLKIAYAGHADGPYNSIGGPFRSGNLRDSDTYVGRSWKPPMPRAYYADWCVEFVQDVA